MNNKKRKLILSILLIIFIQILLYINNNQKTTFRYFIWNIQGIKTGKLITISFFSGLIVSNLIKNSINNKNETPFNQVKNKQEDLEDEDLFNDKQKISSTEIPPQRDIRDPQPTISVNYRVIDNVGGDNSRYEKNDMRDPKIGEDWMNEDDADW